MKEGQYVQQRFTIKEYLARRRAYAYDAHKRLILKKCISGKKNDVYTFQRN